CSRVGSKERISGASGEDYHFTGAQKTNSTTTIIMFNDAAHGNCRHYAGRNVGTLKRVTHGQCVHHRGQHTHVVPGHAIQTRRIQCSAAKQVTTTNNKAYLNANPHQLPYFESHLVEDTGVDSEPFRTHQLLTTQFQQN